MEQQMRWTQPFWIGTYFEESKDENSWNFANMVIPKKLFGEFSGMRLRSAHHVTIAEQIVKNEHVYSEPERREKIQTNKREVLNEGKIVVTLLFVRAPN